MGNIPSRGDSVSGYFPGFGDVSGFKVYRGNMKQVVFTSALANSGVVYGFTHTLGVAPSFVFITRRGTAAGLKGAATSAGHVGVASVSASTATKFYVAGAKNAGFTALLLA